MTSYLRPPEQTGDREQRKFWTYATFFGGTPQRPEFPANALRDHRRDPGRTGL